MMSQYILVIIWFGILVLFSQFVNIYQTEIVLEKKKVCVSWWFAILVIIPLIWWTATRPSWFIDTSSYENGFQALPNTFANISVYLENVKKDKGFSLMSILIKMCVGENVIAYFFVIAFLQIFILAMIYRKYSSNYLMSMFLFVASTDYLSWTHNSIRQFVAVTMILAATELMLKKKYAPLIVIIILVSTIHGSAILMIPIVFVVQGEPWNKKTIFAIMVIVVAIMCVGQFTDWLEILLDDTQYTNVVSDWQSGNDDGTNPIRVLVYSIPTILSLVGYKSIRKENNPIINLSCNMGIISTALYCLSVVTSGIFMGRLPIYCSLYSMGILLPWEIEKLFTKESSKVVTLCMIGGFLVFYYYQVHFGWGLI